MYVFTLLEHPYGHESQLCPKGPNDMPVLFFLVLQPKAIAQGILEMDRDTVVHTQKMDCLMSTCKMQKLAKIQGLPRKVSQKRWTDNNMRQTNPFQAGKIMR